jgi:hypothetical protein
MEFSMYLLIVDARLMQPSDAICIGAERGALERGFTSRVNCPTTKVREPTESSQKLSRFGDSNRICRVIWRD